MSASEVLQEQLLIKLSLVKVDSINLIKIKRDISEEPHCQRGQKHGLFIYIFFKEFSEILLALQEPTLGLVCWYRCLLQNL